MAHTGTCTQQCHLYITLMYTYAYLYIYMLSGVKGKSLTQGRLNDRKQADLDNAV